MSKELNKAPVEQAGGGERVIGWRERILAAHPNSDPGFWPDALLVAHMAAEIADLRAALAQPSGEVVVTKNESGAIVSVTRQDKEGRVLSVIAESQPSPAQAEQADAERPVVVARVVHSNPVVLGQCGPLNANDELMTVAQHAASVARWAEMFNRVEQERDAALAKLAELEKQEPVATVAKVPGEDWNSLDFHRDLQDMQPGTKLYAAPVSQAQRSVPDVCDGKEQDAFEEWARKEGLDTSFHPLHWLFLDAKTNSARQGWKAALRYVRAKIAAPGKAEHSVLDDVETFLDEVRAELVRARTKFPGDRIITIALAEEFGELCKAVLDEPAANVRKEAVQTAVMAARVVLDGDGSVTAWRAERGLDPLTAPGKEGV